VRRVRTRRRGYRDNRRPYLSPITPGSRGRRHRLSPVALGVALLLIAVGVAAIVASANDKGPAPTTASAPDPVSPAAVPAGPRPRPRSRHAQPAGPDSRAVDRVLRYTPFLTAGTPRHRLIALTFDDGPGPYTAKILSVLARMHALATFFVVGQQLADFSAALRDAVGHRMVIGDHTENHAWLIRLNPAGQYAQVNDAAVRMRHAGAAWPRLFRPPYGYYNAHTLALLRELHMLMVLWSIDPRDWLRPGSRAIVERVLAASRPGGIVELHDGGGDRSETVAALPAIISGLRRRRYQLVTVPQLLALDPPPRGQRLPSTIGGA
jgi:peptidoglycan-N-acetylglucosamine deacetylase